MKAEQASSAAYSTSVASYTRGDSFTCPDIGIISPLAVKTLAFALQDRTFYVKDPLYSLMRCI